MIIHILVKAITSHGTFITSIFIFHKAVKQTPSPRIKVGLALWCIAWALLDANNTPWIPQLVIKPIFCAATVIFIWRLYKNNIDTVVSAYLLSFVASLPLLYTASVIIAFAFAPFLGFGFADDSLIDFSNPIYILFYALIALLQFFIAFRFFKIRRFKNGFPFLHEKFMVGATLILAGLVLSINTLIAAQRESYGSYRIVIPLTIGIIVIGAGIVIWIRRSMKKIQKRWAAERNEELLQQEVAELKSQLERLNERNETLRVANHSINHRLASMERCVTELLNRYTNIYSVEASDELAIAIEDIRNLSKDYAQAVSHNKPRTILPSTNIQTLDDLFMLFSERFSGNNVFFKLKVKGSIVHMTESVIERSRLETMIGDHLQNALIAVNASDKATRSVMAVIGEAGDFYEFSVHDSGIPFEIDTLIHLGIKCVTTHTEEGGYGVGFMKTFETMRKLRASLIINEHKPGGVFTKSVTIRFNNEDRFIIETYRREDFPPGDRYIIIGH